MSRTNKPKSELRQLSDDFKRHVGALVEHVDDVFKLTNEEIRGIHQKLDSHTEMIGSVKVDIEIMKGDISMIKFDLKRKVDYDDFAKLEKRVARLELTRSH